MTSNKERLKVFNDLLSAAHAEADLAALAAVAPDLPELAKFKSAVERYHKDILWELCALLSRDQIRTYRRQWESSQSIPNSGPAADDVDTDNAAPDSDNTEEEQSAAASPAPDSDTSTTPVQKTEPVPGTTEKKSSKKRKSSRK